MFDSEGARILNEGLKVNSTLRYLNMSWKPNHNDNFNSLNVDTEEHKLLTVNEIGDEGAFSVSMTLKVNTSLTSLVMLGERKQTYNAFKKASLFTTHKKLNR